jgi:hypothetical protein
VHIRQVVCMRSTHTYTTCTTCTSNVRHAHIMCILDINTWVHNVHEQYAPSIFVCVLAHIVSATCTHSVRYAHITHVLYTYMYVRHMHERCASREHPVIDTHL